MQSGLGRGVVFALCVAAVAAAIVVIVVVYPPKNGGKVVPPAVPVTDKTAVNGETSSVPNMVASSPQEVVAASRLPYDGSNVFVRLPSGVIVRQGEEVPPLEGASRSEADLRAATDEWMDVVKSCSGDARTNGRKVRYTEFAKALGRLPREKRGENLKYAINLMDDANFLLIATLALDRDQPDDLIAEAFDACLNRDSPESRAVIEEISKDKSHPMYVDAARVMDVKRIAEGSLPTMPNTAK